MRTPFLLIVCLLVCCSGISVARPPVRAKRFGAFTIVADSFDAGFRLWYRMRIVVSRTSYRIQDLAPDKGSEFDIRPSPDKRYFVIDAIAKGYEEPNEQEKRLHENYACVIVDVRRHRVVHNMQSECSGSWSKAGKWIVNGRVVFDPQK